MDKNEIRKKFKAIRKNLRGAVTSDFFKTDVYIYCSALLTFMSYGSEISTIELIKKALCDDKIVAVPYMTGKPHEMVFIKINSLDGLKPNKYGIPEPEYSTENIIIPNDKSIIIVPGLAFDNDFNRIGYGGGYYDKYLSENKYLSAVGVCFEQQITNNLPNEKTDRAVDMIVTDKCVRRK